MYGRRVTRFREIFLFLFLIFASSTATAQSNCNATYKFDGNLADSSGNGYDGAAFGKNDEPAAPQFGEGISGQAIRFDGRTGVYTDLDLHFDICPQVTVTGWIRLDTQEPNGTHYIFSVGDRSPLGISLYNGSVVLHGRGGGLQSKNSLRDRRVWFFFAGVYDFDAKTLRLRFRNRTVEGTLPESPREPAGQTFFGARDERLTSPANDIYLDEVKIFGRLLSDDEISRIAAQVSSKPWLTAVAHGAVQSSGAQPTISLPDSANGNRPPIGPTTLPGNELSSGHDGAGSGGEPDESPTNASFSVDGEWVRRDSNNGRNDGMRITVSGGQAVLSYVPSTASNNWHEGEILWQDIDSKGKVQVLGSNNAYYDAEIVVESADIVHIDIDANGPGNDQTWERATPDNLADRVDPDAPLTDQGPMLDPGPAGERGMDPGLTAPDNPPTVSYDPGALPPEFRTKEIICEATTSAQPRVYRRGSFPKDFIAAIGKARECGLRINVAALNRSDQWIVATSGQIAHSTNLPSDLVTALGEFENNYGGLDAADIGEDGGWAIVSGNNIETGNLSVSVAAQIESFATGSANAISLDFYPGDSSRWVAVNADGFVRSSGLSNTFDSALPNRSLTQRVVHQVRLVDPGWLILGSDYWYSTNKVADATLSELKSRQQSGMRLDHVVFGDSSADYLMYSTGPEPNRAGDPLYQIEHGVNNQTIWARMQLYDIPAVSIAMVRNNEIAWARAYGIRNANEPESYANVETTFDAASVSKPIAAVGLLQLVEDGKLSLTDAGVLNDLDELFDDSQQASFDQLQPNVGNLVQLLQHCIDIDYFNANSAAEYDVNLSIPTTTQMILGSGGVQTSSDHRLVRGNSTGVASSYTSANFMLVQGLVDVHGGGFLNHMEPLLSSLGMDKATYRWPYSGQNSGNFARGYDGNNVTDMVGYGEYAAASLVSRPIDIARFVIGINEALSDASATEPLSNAMARRFVGLDGVNDATNDYGTCADNSFGTQEWGLGVRFGTGWNSTFRPANRFYSHGGWHNGYRARMVGLNGIQSGLVMFANTHERNSANRMVADVFFGELALAVIAAYGL